MRPPCTCGCPYTAHQHHHDRDYCGSCAPCNTYTPRRRHWWQVWRQP